jgi:hypothetical protein
MRRLLRATLVLTALAGLAPGCARYSLVEPGPRTIAGVYTVEPRTAWSGVTEGKWEVWTVDGPGLAAIQFLNGLEDGEPLFKAAATQKRVAFRKTMSPSELAELLVDGLTSTGAQRITVTNLRPQKFGSADGFRFELAYVTRNGLDKLGTAAGGIVKDRLYVVLYTGATLHYYDAHREDVERIIQSIRMK